MSDTFTFAFAGGNISAHRLSESLQGVTRAVYFVQNKLKGKSLISQEGAAAGERAGHCNSDLG